ncbi:MAG: hypothetical protein P4L66_12220 [Acetobacteraceae bacterium]|nr:hypothetical protein [Acetobacteraceae bacterium]
MSVRRLLSVVLLLLTACAVPAKAEQVDLSPRPGVNEPVTVLSAPGAVRNVVLFTGSAGGYRGMSNNFVIRIAGQLQAAGFNVAMPDLPSDNASGMSNAFRASAEHATDIAAIIDLLNSRAHVPVWLISTSNGTLSAVNVASRLGPQKVAGLVLTSTVWQRIAAFDDLSQVQVPTLVVHNRDDGCRESPPGMAQAGTARLTHAPVKELIMTSGGISRSQPCQALSPHGYLGVEDQVVVPMIAWIKSH